MRGDVGGRETCALEAFLAVAEADAVADDAPESGLDGPVVVSAAAVASVPDPKKELVLDSKTFGVQEG